MSKLILIKSAADFAKFQRGKSYHSPVMRLVIAFNNQNTPRFGFIIPKKVMAKVTDRNKVKRRFKGILKENLAYILPRDLLIFPRKEALYKKYLELNEETVRLLKQAKIWKQGALKSGPSQTK